MSTAEFRQTGARSRGLLIGLSIALAVESVAVHALIYKRWPAIDVVLIAGNAFTIWWLARNYRAIGERPLVLSDDGLWIRYGTTIAALVPWSRISSVKRAGWKDQPPAATAQFLKLSGGDDPTVLVSCEPPIEVTVLMGVRRTVAVFGLRPDDPGGFVEAAGARVHP